MTKRIVHLTTAHRADDLRIFVKECRSLAAAGYETHVIGPFEADTTQDNVRIHALPLGGNRLYRMTGKQVAAFNKVRALNPALIHFHDPELMIAGFILKCMGFTVVYDAHEDLPRQILHKEWVPSLLRKPLASVLELVENFITHRLDAVVAATAHIADRFSKLNKRSVCVSNYPFLKELMLSTAANWGTREKTAIYAGVLTPERGGHELLKAAYLSKVPVHLVGKLYPDAMQSAVDRLKDKAGVTYYGQIAREKVLDIMQRVRAGIVCFHAYPNHVDAQPNKLFEYMGAGIPVVASNFPLWKDMIETEQCGICVEPTDAKAIADAMRYLMDNDADAQAMGEKGRAAIERRYNWEKEAENLIALYRDILKEA